jgi:hypothetical protein
MAKYEIDSELLYNLLVNNFKLEVFSLYGEEEYSNGLRCELAYAMLELPWNAGRSVGDMYIVIDETGYDINRLVRDQMEAFWEVDKI